ncbi:MAG: hypothetical protein WCO86_14460 [Planctomycetota bacterium]
MEASLEVVAQNRVTPQINAKVPRVINQLGIEPHPTVVKYVVPLNGSSPQQKTAPHRAIHYMPKRNVIRRKHFHTSQPCHDQPPFIIEHGLKQRSQFYLPPVACQKMLCPLRALLADDGVKSQ